MRSYFSRFMLFLGVWSLLAVACNSYEIEGKPEITSNPPKWTVDYILKDADANGEYSDDGTMRKLKWNEFVISNKGLTGELQIFTINLLDPDGRVIAGGDNMEKLFSFEYSNVTTAGKLVVGEGEGYTFVQNNDGTPAFTFDNYRNERFVIAPLCPLVDALAPMTSKCRTGFAPAEYNTYFKVRLNYKQLAPEIYKDMLSGDLKDEGSYAIEFCTNDPAKESSPTTCKEGTSYKVQIYRYPNLPPKPFIGLKYSSPIGGYKDHRVIKDWVNMEINLSCPRKEGADETTCNKIISDTVSGPDTITTNDFRDQCCAANWEEQYCLKYRWEMIETPTPLAPETHIGLDNIPLGGEGNWYEACGELDPTLASFKGYMITPTPEGKYYKISMQAVTIDKQTQLESEITEKIDAPNIIPAARVMVQLTWKEGLQTRAELDRQEGVAVDLDLHLIKKKGMDACRAEPPADGLMCTVMSRPGLPIDTPTHDDCHWNDLGLNGEYVFTDCNGEFKTIGWYAAFDLDNRWGGGDYTNPETINLGPITDENPKDGKPDVNPLDDEYLVMVNYNNCQNLQSGGDEAPCQDGGQEYNVHAKVEIFVDGKVAPREGKTDDDPLSRTTFVIRPREWIVVGTFTWDGTLVPSTPGWVGDAVVHDLPTTHEKVCKFDSTHCRNVTIWDYTAYETWVTTPTPVEDEFGGGSGTCEDYGTRQ